MVEGVKLFSWLSRVMINGNSWGCLYFIVRGEILGFMKDKLMRKHSSRILSFDQERKIEDRRRSDTVVVQSINYADQGLEDVYKLQGETLVV